jgi:hypothetical protein
VLLSGKKYLWQVNDLLLVILNLNIVAHRQFHTFFSYIMTSRHIGEGGAQAVKANK